MKQETVKKLEEQFKNVCAKVDRLELFLIKSNEIKYYKEFIELKKAELDILIEYKEILYQQIKYIYDKINVVR